MLLERLEMNRIKKARQILNLTQQRFGALLGYTDRQIRKLEASSSIPRVTSLAIEHILQKYTKCRKITVNRRPVDLYIASLDYTTKRSHGFRAITAWITINNQSAPFIEYISDGRLDNSSDSAWDNGHNDNLISIITDYVGSDYVVDVKAIILEIITAAAIEQGLLPGNHND